MSQKTGFKIIFMGTPDFAVPALEAIIDDGHEVVAVYTQQPRRKGRGQQVQPSPVQAVAEAARYPTAEIGIYIQPQHHGVSQHVEFSLPFDPKNAKDVERAKQVYIKASQELIAQGAYFSRPYGEWADLVYSRDATATRVLRTVKQIVDPKNVLNPGKLCF